MAIALTPGAPTWNDVEVGEQAVQEINLRAYAWSDACFYGSTQKVVTELRATAQRQRARVASFAPRTGRIWVNESEGGPKMGDLQFVGHSPHGRSRRRFVIRPGAIEGMTPFRG